MSRLADHLRALTDDGLGTLLQLRPDLVVPVPSDISALASRAQGRVSVARALDTLDQFTLEVLDGLRLIRGSDGTAAVETLLTVATEAGADPADARTAIDRLRALFLAYGGDGAVHLVRAVDELGSPYPAGLGRPAAELDGEVAELVADPARLRRTLLSAPPQARAVLDRLAAGPPVGVVRSASLREDRSGTDLTATESPVRWLVDHRLVVALADDMVELPREVGVVLRRDTGPLGPVHPRPPAIEGPVRPGSGSAGAGQALEAVRHVDALLQVLADSPAAVLRSYGLGIRDLRRLARQTGTDESVAALLLEVAYAAGLVDHTDPAGRVADQVWLPTPAYDAWRTGPLARRWVTLARAWLAMTRAPVLIGQRDDRERLISALSAEATKLTAAPLRRAVLAELAELAEGTAPDPADVLARLAWRAPRRVGRHTGPGAPPELVRATLAEAAALGITGLGALTGYGRLLLGGDERPEPEHDLDPLGIRAREGGSGDPLVDALDELLPPPVDHVLVQADLTVVVPGPPEPGLAGELAQVAESESRGGATVYRVTPASVRRALDSGYGASDIHGLFQRRSRTPLPQTLTYLIDDVARRHGGLRAGPATAYLRSDDQALISEVFADRRLAGLSLRRLAPTVLVSSHSTARLLEVLRGAGYVPVAEDSSGAAVLARPKAARAPLRPSRRRPGPAEFEPPRLHGPRLAGIVEQVRQGDRIARAARRSPLHRAAHGPGAAPATSAQAHTRALVVLQQALREQARVWVGYVDSHGGSAARLVRPVSMGAGYLRAEDERSEMLHTFALHRITSAVLDESPAPDR